MSNIFCFHQGAGNNILRRHRNFAAVLNCPNPETEQMVLNSLDGTTKDYNWVIAGKNARNIHIGYPDTIQQIQDYDIMCPAVSDGDTDTSSYDSNSTDSSDDDTKEYELQGIFNTNPKKKNKIEIRFR